MTGQQRHKLFVLKEISAITQIQQRVTLWLFKLILPVFILRRPIKQFLLSLPTDAGYVT